MELLRKMQMIINTWEPRDVDVAIDGDLLEREYGSFIKEKIPVYGEIWKRYIGCAETYENLKSRQNSDEKEKQRLMFAQYHYTCLE
ncbi:MAG TPA: hypothetical protein VFJ29_01060, partial [Candidatus Kapabacteria bacterium]|nr:hypothetical protein [Candidatus Kapabacteria bacterium]